MKHYGLLTHLDLRPRGSILRLIRSRKLTKRQIIVSIDKLFVISHILLFVKGQTDVFTFLSFMLN